jgi:RNA polymerase sigma-70 factor (ECF subfamily)
VGDGQPVEPMPASAFLDQYDESLPHVYGYLLSRCGSRPLAEDLTGDTFLAAVDAVQAGKVAALSTGWLIGVARHKLADHWRAREREERGLRLVGDTAAKPDDPWDAELDAVRARAVLDTLGAHHRAALSLRYLDGLPVAEVAGLLDRTVHATEALLVRARAAFRHAYEATGGANDA